MDELMIVKARKGNKDAFSQIIFEVKDEAYLLAFCYLHNSDDSMDAVCNGIEKAFIHIKKLKNPKYFKTWFLRIVINECNLILREKRRVVQVADDILFSNAKDTSRELYEKVDLERVLNDLPVSERTLIYMKYYLGYTLEEIAEIVQLPEGTVKSKIYNNLKKMRSKLEVREV